MSIIKDRPHRVMLLLDIWRELSVDELAQEIAVGMALLVLKLKGVKI